MRLRHGWAKACARCARVVYAILAPSGLRPDETFYGTVCQSQGVAAPDVVAITRTAPLGSTAPVPVRRAWRADRERLRFVPIATTGLRCVPVLDD